MDELGDKSPVEEKIIPPDRGLVFVSHSQADAEAARALEEKFVAAGFQVVRPHLEPGASLIAELDRAIASADVVVFLLSARATASEWMDVEMAAAVSAHAHGERITIIPVLLEKAQVPPLLERFVWLDATDGEFDDVVDKVLTRRPRLDEDDWDDYVARAKRVQAIRLREASWRRELAESQHAMKVRFALVFASGGALLSLVLMGVGVRLLSSRVAFDFREVFLRFVDVLSATTFASLVAWTVSTYLLRHRVREKQDGASHE